MTLNLWDVRAGEKEYGYIATLEEEPAAGRQRARYLFGDQVSDVFWIGLVDVPITTTEVGELAWCP